MYRRNDRPFVANACSAARQAEPEGLKWHIPRGVAQPG